MAIFHLAAQIIGRALGRSSTAAAAYRLATVIDDERTGQRFDYSRKPGVNDWKIMGPETMPERFRNPAQLWNAVESAEKRHDAQVCREINVALPRELSPDQNRSLVLDWCQNFIHTGMIVCVAFHHLDGDNPHAHIMLTLREIVGDGFGKKVREWNDRRALERWRQTWAVAVNQHLAVAGVVSRVDHRTLDAQGVEHAPTQHQGPIPHAMERRGVVPDRLRVIVPAALPMNDMPVVNDHVHELAEPTQASASAPVHEAVEEVTRARDALHAAEMEESRWRKAEQQTALEHAKRQHDAERDRKMARAAQQRSDVLRQQVLAAGDAMEQWKRAHRWRLWLCRHGFRAAIPRVVQQADAERIRAQRNAAKAAQDYAGAIAVSEASRGAFARASNAHQHSQTRLAQAQQRLDEAAERWRQACVHWQDVTSPGYEQRQTKRQRQEVTTLIQSEPVPIRRSGRHL